jgi:HAD superfamily hydrolase (TIGR01509 family)
MNPIDLIIFDCDGVLVDSEVLSSRAMQAVLRAQGIEVSLDTIAGCVGMKQADILARIERETGHVIGPSVGTDLWPATRVLFGEHLSATTGLTAFLDATSTRRCVASSSSHERIAFSLSVTEIAPYFEPDAIFSSSDVTRGKPAPDLFLHAAARMGVAPERCVVIEDSPFGVMGAVAAGMTAIGFTGGSHSGPVIGATLMAAGAVAIESRWADVARWVR